MDGLPLCRKTCCLPAGRGFRHEARHPLGHGRGFLKGPPSAAIAAQVEGQVLGGGGKLILQTNGLAPEAMGQDGREDQRHENHQQAPVHGPGGGLGGLKEQEEGIHALRVAALGLTLGPTPGVAPVP